MHSPFTFNPNVHQTASNYQQQRGFQQPIYNIGAPPVISFVSHQSLLVNHGSFTRSFASVVSCENNLEKRQNMLNVNRTNNQNNSSSGIIGSFLRQFNKPPTPQYQHPVPSTTQHKEFEDFIHMPSLSADHSSKYGSPKYCQQPPSNHINLKMQTPSDSQYQAQPSANNNNNSTMAKKGFMASLFSCQQQQQGPPKPRWFRNSFRYRGGSWRSQNNKSGSKFHDHDVNLQKNVHEKERSCIERDIKDDSCDFVHVEDENVISDVSITNNPNETAKGSCSTSQADDPPFMIYSMEEFPAIVTTCSSRPAVEKKPPAKHPESKSCEGFVVVPDDAAVSTPTFTPKRLSLCEKFIKSPQKLFPNCTPIVLKPCLKAPRRRVSECSDDFIVFAEGDDYQQSDSTFSDIESETDSEADDDDSDDEMSEIVEEEDEESEAEDIVDCAEAPEQQVDSGLEEKMVSCAKKQI